MARRLIARVESEDGQLVSRAYRDTEWQEFAVEFYKAGAHQTDSDYHTDSRKDALDTADAYVRG